MSWKTAFLLLCLASLAACTSATAPATPVEPTPSQRVSPSTTTPVPEAIATQMPSPEPGLEADFILMTAVAPQVIQTSQSPDGGWEARVIEYACTLVGTDEMAYDQLLLRPTAGDADVVIGEQLRYCQGLGAYGLAVRFWSDPSRYLYYTDARLGAPDGCSSGWWPTLFRYDTSNGDVRKLSDGPAAPDGSRLASYNGKDLLILWVDTGQIAILPPSDPKMRVTSIAWSPDGTKLIYIQKSEPCGAQGLSNVVRVEVANLKSTILLSYMDPSFTNVTWDAPNRVTLYDIQDREWRYNLVTRDLIEHIP